MFSAFPLSFARCTGFETVWLGGLECYEQGGALYELRHFLIFTGQTYQLLKPVLGPAWDVLARWEEIRHVCAGYL